MNAAYPEFTDLSTLWGLALQPAHCPICKVAHLIPSEMKNAVCPACFGGYLDDQPTVIRQEPPELLVNFTITPDQVRLRVQDWVKGIWLHPKELEPDILTQRLTRTYIPLWLIDGKVIGSWQAQMGYDYKVASSQELFQNGTWKTHKLTETRIRWETRVGSIDRLYQNLRIPALEEYAHLMNGLGIFKLEAASTYSPKQVENASIRIPSLLPDAAWPLAKSNFDRLSAKDCQIAADAQHIDEYIIQANYDALNWTQLLLPVYTTAYRDEDGNVHPILVNGQNGNIFGRKRASQRQARNLSLGLTAVALFCFLFGLLFAAGTTLLPLLGFVSLLFFSSALLTGITAPLPAIWAWNFNRLQDSE